MRTYMSDGVGERGFGAFLRYELATTIAAPFPGSVGYALRKVLFPGLFRRCERGAQFGSGLRLLHPHKIEIGENFGIDDNALLDARKVKPGEFVIGDRALIAREACIIARTERGRISIGHNSMISRKCVLSSSHGLEIGSSVAIGGMSIIGGWPVPEHYDTPADEQEGKDAGPIVIEDDCILGAGVRVMDGVTIGQGSVIAAGAIVKEDVSKFSLVGEGQPLEMYRVQAAQRG